MATALNTSSLYDIEEPRTVITPGMYYSATLTGNLTLTAAYPNILTTSNKFPKVLKPVWFKI